MSRAEGAIEDVGLRLRDHTHARDTIRTALRPVRQRILLLAFARSSLWAASLLVLATALLRGDRFVTNEAGTALFAACLIGAASFIAISVLRSWHNSDDSAIARLADKRFELRERLSTSLETPVEQSVVAAALHHDTTQFLDRIDPLVMIPWQVPRLAILALVLSSALPFVFAEYLASPRSHADLAPLADVDKALPEFTPERLQELADVLERQAALEDNAYLAVIAHEIRELASTQLGDEVVSDVYLESLFEHLSRAHGGNEEGRAVAGRMLAPDYAVGQAQAEAHALLEQYDSPAAFDGQQQAPLGVADDGGSALDVASASNSAEGAGEVAPGPTVLDSTMFALDALDAIGEQDVALHDSPDGIAELIGGADDASAGESLVAGFGSENLEGDGSAPLAEARFEEAIVRGRERDDGRRIEVLVAPRVAEQTSDRFAITLGTWQYFAEAGIQQDVVPPAYRSMLGRYRVPGQSLSTQTSR